jgi:hypothetical protein
VTEDHRLSLTPVFVVDIDAARVFFTNFDIRHVYTPFSCDILFMAPVFACLTVCSSVR